jgi:hypothetical protein
MITINNNGRVAQISMNRWKKRSNFPPKYPIAAPRETPIKYEMMVNIIPKEIDILKPNSSRANTSRPTSSVPSQC